MKKFKHGMVLGKFYPPTLGHKYLIDTALNQCDVVTLFICSLKQEKISGKLRYQWLKSIYSNVPNINIVWIQDELPQTPEEYGDFDKFYKLWVDAVHSHESNMDVLFTSENYGDEFADKLGIKHILVDLSRTTYPVSGTSVRNNPIDNWEYIPDEVRPYFKKTILIIGPESTGKSTLTKKLTDYYDGDIVHEFGRNYTNLKPAKKMVTLDYETIAELHNSIIDITKVNGNKPLIFIDTDAMTTKLFGEMYLGNTFKSNKIDKIIKDQKFDLILVCDTYVPWVDDGTRDFPDDSDRMRHFNKIIKELKLIGRPYKLITGDYDERFNVAKDEVNKLLN